MRTSPGSGADFATFAFLTLFLTADFLAAGFLLATRFGLAGFACRLRDACGATSGAALNGTIATAFGLSIELLVIGISADTRRTMPVFAGGLAYPACACRGGETEEALALRAGDAITN